MSGTSSDQQCPICNEMMEVYSDWKPFEYSVGKCLNCGFAYYPEIYQLNLKLLNELRKEYNENYDTNLKPLTKKDLSKWSNEIKNIL